jgi:hypothetical protein
VGSNQAHHGNYHAVQVERGEMGRPNPGEIKELAQEPAQPVALPDDEAR